MKTAAEATTTVVRDLHIKCRVNRIQSLFNKINDDVILPFTFISGIFASM